jgi:hypothetical protein
MERRIKVAYGVIAVCWLIALAIFVSMLIRLVADGL